MKKYDLGPICVGVAICLIAFLTSNNLIIGIAIGIIYILYYFLLLRKKITKYYESTSRLHSCYNFINNFLITLSTKESLEDAYESGIRNPNSSFKEFSSELKDMNVNEKLEYLAKYFHFSLYKMFLNVISIYSEQGGNVLKVADTLIDESRRIEETLIDSESLNKKKLTEFIILWALALVVLLFMRFALTNFYLTMLKSPVFIILLVAFFLLMLLSIHLFANKFSKLPIKEEKLKYE